jgi:hypothetical protein
LVGDKVRLGVRGRVNYDLPKIDLVGDVELFLGAICHLTFFLALWLLQ